MFWIPRTGKIGLGISLISYAGKVTLGIVLDEKLLPDPDALLDEAVEELNDLLELVKSGKIEDAPLGLHDRYQATRCNVTAKRGSQCKKRVIPGSNIVKPTRIKQKALARPGMMRMP